MFRGHTFRSLDAKGRLMLPPEFRSVVLEQDAEGRVMLTNFDGCVAAYPIPEWQEIETSFSKANLVNRSIRNFQRFFIAGAMEVTLDKQGRVLIPPHLRDYAKLDRDVVLAGVGRKFEIWDQERFNSQMEETEQQFDQIMDELSGTGFELYI
ncbi:MAG: division/cell wall cluster transcriptional repressor MraZ [Desulfohalobiaceae bacterium]